MDLSLRSVRIEKTCLEGLRKTTKSMSEDSCLQAEVQSPNILSTKQES